MENLNNKILNLEKDLAILKNKYAEDKKEFDCLNKKISNIEEDNKFFTECVEVLKNLDSDLRIKITKHIEKIVTDFYRYIFQTNDSFKIKYTVKRGVVNADFVLETIKSGKKIELNPLEDDAGGKVDIIALGLRIASLLLYSPKLPKILILDEPLKYVSNSLSGSDYKKRAADFLKKFSEKNQIQLIIVTHDSEFVEVADKKFEVSLDSDGFSKVVENIT